MIMLMERPKLPISGPVAPLAAEREGGQRVIARTGNRLCRFGRTAGYRRGAQERCSVQERRGPGEETPGGPGAAL